MYKLLLLLCLSFFSLHAADFACADSFKEAMIKAQLENKKIMVLITTKSCRWCRKLESKTLKDKTILERLNRDYISVHLTRGVDEYPRYLNAPGVPATYFLDKTGQPIIRRVMGYWNVEDYHSFLDDVDYRIGKKEY